MASLWPETPFRLIIARPEIPPDHYCRTNAQTMALTHNSMFRGFNAIYNQALQVQPGTQDAKYLLLYCTMVHDFIHNHQQIEEVVYFPRIEKAAGSPGLMSNNVEQHKEFEKGLQKFRKYAENEPKEAYATTELRSIIDELTEPLGVHLRDEIPTILDLYDKVESKTLEGIYLEMEKEARKADAHEFPLRIEKLTINDASRSGPFVFRTQDREFMLDGKKHKFPNVPVILPYVIDYVLARRYAGAWRFGPSNMYGQPRQFTGKPA